MADFLSRENELLGDEFSTPTGGTFATASGDDIDFDLAASAFPDISLDGDFPTPSAPPVAQTSSSGGFSFDDFDSPPVERTTEVKVTGDDEIEKFENEFPEIEMPSVSSRTSHCLLDMNVEHALLRIGTTDILSSHTTFVWRDSDIRTSTTTPGLHSNTEPSG